MLPEEQIMSGKRNTVLDKEVLSIARRDFLKIASAAGALGISCLAYSSSNSSLPISMAGYDYDRVQYDCVVGGAHLLPLRGSRR